MSTQSTKRNETIGHANKIPVKIIIILIITMIMVIVIKRVVFVVNEKLYGVRDIYVVQHTVGYKCRCNPAVLKMGEGLDFLIF